MSVPIPNNSRSAKMATLAFIANEDEGSLSIVDLRSGQEQGRVKVSEEPEGVGSESGKRRSVCDLRGKRRGFRDCA